MSIILDALRGGRGKRPTGPSPNTAQTDAVLHTLGYGRFNPTTPVNRLKRALGLVAIAVLLGVGLWVAVIWMTRTFMAPTSAPYGASVGRPSDTAARASVGGPGDTPAGASAARPAVPVAAAPAPTVPAATSVAPAPESTASARVPTAPVAQSTPVGSDDQVNVRPSQRFGVPSSVPVPPAGTPSRSKGSPAGASAAIVTAGDDHFGRAMMYQRLGDFENALISYRQVLQRDDLNVEAHNNLGVLYRDKSLFDDAIRHFQRAIAINPGYARARNNLGVVYLSQRRFDMAATQFHAALAIDPKNIESMVNLSTVEKESGRRDQARAWLARALDGEPRNAEAHYNLGLIEDEAGSRPQALAHYRAFLQYGAAVHPALVGEVRKRIAELESRN